MMSSAGAESSQRLEVLKEGVEEAEARIYIEQAIDQGGLPPELAKDTPKVEIHRISEYDQDGPFWAWNWLKLGEHSGRPVSGKPFTAALDQIGSIESPCSPRMSAFTCVGANFNSSAMNELKRDVSSIVPSP